MKIKCACLPSACPQAARSPAPLGLLPPAVPAALSHTNWCVFMGRGARARRARPELPLLLLLLQLLPPAAPATAPAQAGRTCHRQPQVLPMLLLSRPRCCSSPPQPQAVGRRGVMQQPQPLPRPPPCWCWCCWQLLEQQPPPSGSPPGPVPPRVRFTQSPQRWWGW